MRKAPQLHGLLLVDKPTGCTSHDIVHRARRALGEKKVGHCGTLDPEATGLLLLTVGRSTRLTRFLIRAPKVYVGHIRLGVTTDTYDASGQVLDEQTIEPDLLDRLDSVMKEFDGGYDQIPPPYCAKKTGGVKYYELARRGEEVPREAKRVEIYSFARNGEIEPERVPFRLSCSSGTYARSLAHDLGQRLGCGAHLADLRRLQVGPFSIDDAFPGSTLGLADATDPVASSSWIPFDQIPLPFHQIETDAQQEKRIRHGQTVLVPQLEGEEGDWIKLVNEQSQLIAVGTVAERIGGGSVSVIQPRIVFK